MITKNEAAIISSCSGCIIGNYDIFLKYAEEKMGYSIFTYELDSEEFWITLKKLSTEDFKRLHVEK